MILLVDDIQIGYDDAGAGIPLILLHGFPHSRALWAPQLSALLDRCRMIAPDLRGFGETSVRPPFTMDRYADDVVALMDGLRIERAVIGGLSMGGYIAFAMWRRHRARIRALVLADTRAGADTPEGIEKRRSLIALARDRGAALVADAQLPGMLGRTTRDKQPGVVESLREIMAKARPEGIIGALEAMIARPDSTADLATIDVPTLVIVGEEDALTPPKEARRLHSGIPGSELEVISGAGHVSNLERPAAFNHVLSEFLSRLTYA